MDKSAVTAECQLSIKHCINACMCAETARTYVFLCALAAVASFSAGLLCGDDVNIL